MTRWNHGGWMGVAVGMTRLCCLLVALVGACASTEPPPRASDDAPRELPAKEAEAPPAVQAPVAPPTEVVAPAVNEPPASAPIPAYAEQLGGLRLGMTIAELQAARPSLVPDGDVVPIPPEGGPNYAIAKYGRRLVDTAADLAVELESPTKDGEFRTTAIWAEIDATAETDRGVGIGATRRAVKKAYPRARALVEDELYARISDDEEVWFGFEQGKVMRIRLGPATDPDDIEE